MANREGKVLLDPVAQYFYDKQSNEKAKKAHYGSKLEREMIGKRFGKLVVISKAPSAKNGDSMWRCHCDCGVDKIVRGYHLRKGTVISCGCVGRGRSSTYG